MIEGRTPLYKAVLFTAELRKAESVSKFSIPLFPDSLCSLWLLSEISNPKLNSRWSETRKKKKEKFGEKMMVEKEDLGLSLSLSTAEKQHHPLQLNLMLSSVSSATPSPFLFQKNSWNEAFASSDRNLEIYRGETRSFLKGIDVNRLPSTAECEDEAVVSSPNSTISSVSGKRSERETTGDELEIERACSRGMSDEEDGDGSRKKLRLSKDQSAILEESFKEHNTLNPKQKLALAKQLNLRPRQVEVWFQNRRARTKLKQTEVDCEFLKRCCENLTEENRRLQKEVQELRALKLSPQFYMHMTPPTTLTMCPSCERVAVSSTSSAPGANQPSAPLSAIRLLRPTTPAASTHGLHLRSTAAAADASFPLLLGRNS